MMILQIGGSMYMFAGFGGSFQAITEGIDLKWQ